MLVHVLALVLALAVEETKRRAAVTVAAKSLQ